MAAHTLTCNGTTIDLLHPGNYPFGTDISRTQPREYAKTGSMYLYDRGTRTGRFNLIITAEQEVVDAIHDFFDNHAKGKMRPVTWQDHTGTIRTVKLAGQISIDPLTSIKNRVTIPFESAA